MLSSLTSVLPGSLRGLVGRAENCALFPIRGGALTVRNLRIAVTLEAGVNSSYRKFLRMRCCDVTGSSPPLSTFVIWRGRVDLVQIVS